MNPVFRYVSKCCNELAKKPALIKTKEADGSLGTWRCTKCKQVCSCIRHKPQENNLG